MSQVTRVPIKVFPMDLVSEGILSPKLPNSE